MKDDEMITLGIFESKIQKPVDPYEVFTCEQCDFATCDRIGRCSKCGGRMLNSEEENVRKEGASAGIGFIITACLYLIFPAIYMSTDKFNFADLFTKASSEAFWSVSKFTYLFGLPMCFIVVGIILLFTKKDSILTRFLGIGLTFGVLIVMDFVVFPMLSH